MTPNRKAEFESAKLAKRLRRQVGQAIADYSMIEAGDQVLLILDPGLEDRITPQFASNGGKPSSGRRIPGRVRG